MTHETWLVVAVGAAFLLLGIAASPIGWVALLHRRSRGDRRSQELAEQVQALQARLERCEAGLASARQGAEAAEWTPTAGAITFAPAGPIARRRGVRRFTATSTTIEGVDEPKLIAVPKLPASQDRPAMQGALSQRYAAIWELAESGASADAIARVTGQPIGQIELILGLRRQMDAGNRSTIPHASHE